MDTTVFQERIHSIEDRFDGAVDRALNRKGLLYSSLGSAIVGLIGLMGVTLIQPGIERGLQQVRNTNPAAIMYYNLQGDLTKAYQELGKSKYSKPLELKVNQLQEEVSYLESMPDVKQDANSYRWRKLASDNLRNAMAGSLILLSAGLLAGTLSYLHINGKIDDMLQETGDNGIDGFEDFEAL